MTPARFLPLSPPRSLSPAFAIALAIAVTILLGALPWQSASAEEALLLRRLVIGPLVAVPASPAASVATTRGVAAAAHNDPDAQAHLAQALAATGAFSLQLRADVDPRPPAEGLAAFRASLAGVDALLAGSVAVSPASPATPGALVTVRMSLRAVDPYSGQPLLTLGGAGEGAGRDQALALAARDAAHALQAQLAGMPWQAYVLGVDGDRVRLSAGEAQGLRPGQMLDVQTQGDRVRSRRTGLLVVLPGRSVARLRVDGDGLARRVSGSLAGLDLRELVVRLPPADAAAGADTPVPLSSQPTRNSP